MKIPELIEVTLDGAEFTTAGKYEEAFCSPDIGLCRPAAICRPDEFCQPCGPYPQYSYYSVLNRSTIINV
jgi:hypothetical protein